MISAEGLSVPALLDAAAGPDRDAAVFPDARASLTELSALSVSYARALVSLGVGPGDHVGALLPAGLGVVALILGAARIGAVAVPFNTRLRAGEIGYLVDHSDARIMLVSPEGADLLAAAFPGLSAQRGPVVRVPEAACLRSVAVGHCREQLATSKVPRYVRFVSEWPMSGTKIQKGRLRQRIADELAAASVTEAPRLMRPTAQA